MQLGGVSGHGHGADAHHVTNCMHNHSHLDKVGEMGAAAANAGVRSMMAAESQADAQFSLSAWLNRTLNGGRSLWGRIWGNGEGMGTADQGSRADGVSGAERVSVLMPYEREESGDGQQGLNAAQIAAAASAVRQPQEVRSHSHMRSAGGRREKLVRRAGARLKEMTGQLAGNLSERLRGSQAGKRVEPRLNRSREAVRRQARSGRDELVISCAQTEDSYLLDSYDRKGEYSRLSASNSSGTRNQTGAGGRHSHADTLSLEARRNGT